MNEVFIAIFPGMMYFWLFFIGQGPMQEILYEKERHTLQRLLAATVTIPQYLLSKMAHCFLLCGLIQSLLVLICLALFCIKWGNPFFLGVVVLSGAWSVAGVLAFIYSLARTREQATTLSPIVLLVFGMVGGSMFPFESLPRFLQAVGTFSPNRWGILALQGIIQAKPLAELAKPILILVAIGLCGCLSAYFLFQRHLLSSPSK